MNDDLPAPLGPTSATKSFRRSTAVKSSTRTRPGTSTRRSLIAITWSPPRSAASKWSVIAAGSPGGGARRGRRSSRLRLPLA